MSHYKKRIQPIETELDASKDIVISPTYGEITIKEALNHILEYYERTRDINTEFEIVVGTDSQNFYDYCKIVPVIMARRVSAGGNYFYKYDYTERIDDVRKKLNIETQLSLLYANTILEILEKDSKYEELYINTKFSIHVDAGMSDEGKTKDLIPGIVGWINGTLHEINVEIKPESYCSSSVADMLSK